MVNREKRMIATGLIRRFASAEITNDEFVEAFPRDKADPALKAIDECLWYCYDDLQTHTLTGKHALTAEGQELFVRCCTFLESDLEYEWPPGIHGPSIPILFVNAFLFYARLVGFKDAGVTWEKRRHDRLMTIGDYEAWPFMRAEDLEVSRSLPPNFRRG